MIVYFSGTGNSRYCAKKLAKMLGDEALDSFHFIKDGVAAELASDKPWVFVAPTYSWKMPKPFVEFIKRGSFSESREAYFVMTCGSEIGNAGEENCALCAAKGIKYRGTYAVPMPNNYIVMSDIQSEAEDKRIIAAAEPLLSDCARLISGDTEFPVTPVRLMDRLKSGIVNTSFNRFYARAKKFAATDVCIGCGKCVKYCVLNNIILKNKTPVWGNNCTHCMACISSCPVTAIEYGKATVGRRRYQCHDLEG